MAKEIKFRYRLQRLDPKKGHEELFEYKTIEEIENWSTTATILSRDQFTGLKDSTKWEQLTKKEQADWLIKGGTKETWNGKEIYEGDVTEDTHGKKWRIIWKNENASFWAELVNDDESCRAGHHFEVTTWAEVIGNIYEHSNLLNQEELKQ